jgi:spermidine synthase
VIGFVGGCIPLVLHHYLHEAVIECTEIEPAVVDAATSFFGVQMDDRLIVTVQDGREYLAGCGPGIQYDMIVVDVVLGNGQLPYHLATGEFYDLCQVHLSAGGVVVVNLLDEDAFHADKVKTIQSAFGQTYLCPVPGGNTVVFATQGISLDEAELIERAKSLQNYHRFSFPFVKRALELRMCSVSECALDLDQAQILRDDSPPDGYSDHLLSFDGG